MTSIYHWTLKTHCIEEVESKNNWLQGYKSIVVCLILAMTVLLSFSIAMFVKKVDRGRLRFNFKRVRWSLLKDRKIRVRGKNTSRLRKLRASLFCINLKTSESKDYKGGNKCWKTGSIWMWNSPCWSLSLCLFSCAVEPLPDYYDKSLNKQSINKLITSFSLLCG